MADIGSQFYFIIQTQAYSLIHLYLHLIKYSNMKPNVLILMILLTIVLSSCGDEEPECIVPTSSFSMLIDGESISEGTAIGGVSNTTLGGFITRYVELYFTFNDGRTFTIGIQDLETDIAGVCIENRSYSFEGEAEDCIMVDMMASVCNESDIEYIDGRDARYTDFIQVGSVTVTSCNIEKSTISGSFSGTLDRNALGGIEVSGTFTDILVEE